ncbi:MAG: DUF3667 domain-containing protein [Rhodothermales bacterium]|nr:DUF3667 domain-containing protein [Rhodothermales bacterium]MBO6778340.1 DUF3667 domain-containing protein [Rhodothermales bacterium]
METCPTCGTDRPGAFCPQCGERRVEPEDRTVRALIGRLFGEVTNVDSVLWRTVGVLLVRPGRLARFWAIGRRRAYLHPVRLFLLMNVVYFLVQPLTTYTGYNTPLRSQMERQFYSDHAGLYDVVRARVTERLHVTLAAEDLHPDSLARPVYEARWQSEFRNYEERFDGLSSRLASSLVIVIIPFLALTLVLLYLGRRRLAADHVVFATHLMAWDLIAIGVLYLGAFVLLTAGLVELMGGEQAFREFLLSRPRLAVWFEGFSELGSMIPFGFYVFFGLRRFYEDAVGAAALRALVLCIVYLALVLAYRFLLFWLTYWQV